jgi:hypothetical protein
VPPTVVGGIAPDVGVIVGVTDAVPGGSGNGVMVGVPEGVGVPKVGVGVTVPTAVVGVRVANVPIVGSAVMVAVGVTTAVVPGSKVGVGCTVTGVNVGSGPTGVRLGPSNVSKAMLSAPKRGFGSRIWVTSKYQATFVGGSLPQP